MSTSQTVPDEGSQPSSTPELQSSPNDSTSSPDPEVILINNDDENNEGGPGGKKLRSEVWKHFDKKKIDGVWKAVCKYCEDKLRPLSIVDHVGFKRYSVSLQPLFKVPCRNTIKNEIFQFQPLLVSCRNRIKNEIFQIYELDKVKTLSLLESNASRVAITTDMWTASNQKKGYMAVTAHFVDVSWTLQSRIIRFIYVPCPHTKEVLCQHLVDCLMDWNLDSKLSCLTVDNCSTNDAMIDMILEKLDSSKLVAGGSLFHMRCTAHILNLIVKDGLDVIKVGIEKIRDSVAFWTTSPKREEKFEEAIRQCKNPNTKKLGLDCSTRWNSTYLMLETALLYKDVFFRLSQRESQYKSMPSKEEWDFAQDVCGRLKYFFKATEVFSGTKYPTANLCFINICEIRLAMTNWRKSSNFVIQIMAEKMLQKFEKYWHVMHGVVGVAAVLDPRYKLEVLEFYFDKIFGDHSSVKVDTVRDLCYSLLKEYHEKLIAGSEGNGDSYSTCSISTSANASQYDLFISTKKRKKVDFIKSELDHYLEEDVLPTTDGFDVLTWWKVNATKYPTLQYMARDFLAIPASTVASESAFSSSGRLVSTHRNRLHPKTIQALMFAQSWLWAAEMKGESSSGYATIYNDMESEDPCGTREV